MTAAELHRPDDIFVHRGRARARDPMVRRLLGVCRTSWLHLRSAGLLSEVVEAVLAEKAAA